MKSNWTWLQNAVLRHHIWCATPNTPAKAAARLKSAIKGPMSDGDRIDRVRRANERGMACYALVSSDDLENTWRVMCQG